MYKKFGYKTMAVLHSLDDYGEDIRVEIKREFEKAGGKVVAEEGFNVGERDFAPILTKIRAKNPDAIFLACLSTEAALVARQKKEVGVRAQLVGQAGNASEAYIKGAGDAGEGTLYAVQSPFPETLADGPAYVKAYKEAGYKEPYDVYGVMGYTAGQVIIELLKRHGPNRVALVKGVRELKDFNTLIGKKKYFDKNGEIQPKPEGWGILKSARWIPYEVK
jgi:branched-chain amino acid transport system substrate-binding protein